VICSAKVLAEVIGISRRQVERLTEAGVLKPVRRSNESRARRYRLSDSLQSFLKHDRDRLREQFSSSNGNSEYNRARTARMRALARSEELELQVRSGEMIKRSVVIAAVGNVVSITKDHMLGVPNKVMHQLVGRTSAAETNQIVRTHIVTALRELSNFDVSSIDLVGKKNGAEPSES
jgi:phage terminase Nu1 subunit (DNA packaging protein)